MSHFYASAALGANARYRRVPLDQFCLARWWWRARQAVVDSSGHRVAVIETTAVRVIRLGDIDLGHALGEGEGYSSVAEWRAGHEGFWHSAEVRSELGDPQFTVNDNTFVVAQTFSLLER